MVPLVHIKEVLNENYSRKSRGVAILLDNGNTLQSLF